MEPKTKKEKSLIEQISERVDEIDPEKITRTRYYPPCYEVRFDDGLRIEVEDCNLRPGDMPSVISMKVYNEGRTFEFGGEREDPRAEEIYYKVEQKFKPR